PATVFGLAPRTIQPPPAPTTSATAARTAPDVLLFAARFDALSCFLLSTILRAPFVTMSAGGESVARAACSGNVPCDAPLQRISSSARKILRAEGGKRGTGRRDGKDHARSRRRRSLSASSEVNPAGPAAPTRARARDRGRIAPSRDSARSP